MIHAWSLLPRTVMIHDNPDGLLGVNLTPLSLLHCLIESAYACGGRQISIECLKPCCIALLTPILVARLCACLIEVGPDVSVCLLRAAFRIPAAHGRADALRHTGLLDLGQGGHGTRVRGLAC